MAHTRILSIAAAMPPHYYTQQEICDELAASWQGQNLDAATLERFHSRVGVDGRHLALPLEQYRTLKNFGNTNDLWIENALKLGEQAVRTALDRAGLTPASVNAMIFVSITGISAPSIDAMLINRMGLPTHMRRTPIFGLGCVAGASGIAQAADYLRAYPNHVAVLLSVELCSLTFQRDDTSVANLISTGLFGDGACAVVLAGAEHIANQTSHTNLGPAIIDTLSSFYPGTEDTMGWQISERGFRILLNSNVPQIIQDHFAKDVDAFLARHALRRSDIAAWTLHTGGPKVLDAMAASLALPPEAVALSRDALRRAGNLSSAAVLVLLEETLYRHRPAPDAWGYLAAMGPGFCSQSVLLRW